MPKEDAFAKKRRLASDVVDQEIEEMKLELKSTIARITQNANKPLQFAADNASTNVKDDRLYHAIRMILENVPLKYQLNCMIDIQAIVNKYAIDK